MIIEGLIAIVSFSQGIQITESQCVSEVISFAKNVEINLKGKAAFSKYKSPSTGFITYSLVFPDGSFIISGRTGKVKSMIGFGDQSETGAKTRATEKEMSWFSSQAVKFASRIAKDRVFFGEKPNLEPRSNPTYVSVHLYEKIGGSKGREGVNHLEFKFSPNTKELIGAELELDRTYGNKELRISESAGKASALKILKSFYPEDVSKVYRVEKQFIAPIGGYGSVNYAERKTAKRSEFGYAVVFLDHTVYVHGSTGVSLDGVRFGYRQEELQKRLSTSKGAARSVTP